MLSASLSRMRIRERSDRAPRTQDYIARRTPIDYAKYARDARQDGDEIRGLI